MRQDRRIGDTLEVGGEAPPPRQPGWREFSKLFSAGTSPPVRISLCLIFVYATALLAMGLEHGLGIQRVSMLFLAAVVAASILFGISYGIFTSLAATVAFNFISPAPPFTLDLGTRQDLLNVFVFLGGAWFAGIYGDELRTSREALRRFRHDQAEIAPPQSHRRLALYFERRPLLRETLRLLAAVLLCASGAALAIVAQDRFGIERVSMIYAAAVVVSALALGARFGLITAVVNVAAFDFFQLEPRYTLALDSTQALVNLAIFVGLAWWAGTYAEQVRYERTAVRTLFEAGRSLSATADEPALRTIICEAVRSAIGGRYVEIQDENGRSVAALGEARGRQARPTLPGPPPGVTRQTGPWRVRALAAEGRGYGWVVWARGPRWGESARQVDRTVAVLVDLGGAAISRARLSAEHAHLEVVAQAEQLRRALLASVSHDLRSPLAGILGSAASLLTYSHDEAVRRDLLKNIEEQASRLSRYVENMLGMTRLEAGVLAPQVRPMLLEPLIYETWEGLGARADPARLRVLVHEDMAVSVDPALFQLALGNLLENALKFSPPATPIELTARREDDEAIGLVISDHGPGLSQQDIDRLFEPFTRGDRGPGFGLGLYIAKSFIEAMGGGIEVTPRHDGRDGVAFTLSLPAVGVPA